MHGVKLTLTALLIGFSAACSGSADFQGLPSEAVPQPAQISPQTQAAAAAGAVTLQAIARREPNPPRVTPEQATALLLIIEAAAEDRAALRILRQRSP